MCWELRYERDGFSVEAARKKRRPIAADHWSNNKPVLPTGSDFFLAAYRDLVSCRPDGGPIPWTAAMAYADRKGLEPDLADALWAVVSRMDLAERRWRFDNAKTEVEGG